jgi:DNA polymerase delta subunit 1
VLGLPGFFRLGRLRGQATVLRTRETNTKAYGHNEFHYLPMAGRMQMDIYQLIKKEHRLSSYKLDSLARHFLKDEKDEEHDDLVTWVGGHFDPEGFDVNRTNSGLRERCR